MKIKPQKIGVIRPRPYFKIAFGCDTREFYHVRSALVMITDVLDIAYANIVIEKDDYDDNLSSITIPNNLNNRLFISRIFRHFDMSMKEFTDDMDLVLSIF